MKNKSRLVDRKFLIPFVLITSLFFLWGYARAILDVLNKHFQDSLHISLNQSALIQVMTYLGYFLMAFPAGLFMAKFGYRKGVVLGLIMFALGAFLFIPSMYVGTFEAFLVALFVIGCGLTFLEVAANPYTTLLGPPSTATSRLNFSQSFNGLGCVLAPLSVGTFLYNSDTANVSVPYVVMGILVLLVAIIFSQIQLPEVNTSYEQQKDDSNTQASTKDLFKHSPFVFGLIALLAYEVSEISINSYFVNFVTGNSWLDGVGASYVLSFALMFFMVGRFVGSWLMRFIPSTRVLSLCGLGSVACMLVVMMNCGIISEGALVLNYLFEAIMFPTIYSLALGGLSQVHTRKAGGVLMMTPVGGCGFLLMTLIAGWSGSLFVPFLIPLAGYIIVATYALWLHRRKH